MLLLQKAQLVGATKVVLLKLWGLAPASISRTAERTVWTSVSKVTFSFSISANALNDSNNCYD
jgi:hypothetical protein